jgi:superfamily II DNA or RNA helicase
VCSDETVADSDSPVSSTHDLGVPVTTDVNEINRFLRRRGHRVVFSTYQSSPQIAAAYRQKNGRPPSLDLVICDEAHRCAGPVTTDFATILDSRKIPAERRLFMTATPRYFTGRVRREAREADFEIASMDDEATFGPVFHRLTFGQAIEQDLLSDYQVVIVGVDDATYKDWATRGKYVTLDGVRITDARALASQIGLAKAMRKFNLRRMISFHNRVEAARQFSRELPEVIAWMPSGQRPAGGIRADYVSGAMPTGERRRRLSRLANPGAHARALLANARCLAEGIDVPTLDGVSFIEPRRSEVDIVQAVGRAIRKAPGKKLGTIVLPVFINTVDDPEVALDDSAFKPVWDVIRALRSHDETLGEQLDSIRRSLGLHGRTAASRPRKIHVMLPARVTIDFSLAFNLRVVEQATATWEFWFGVLQRYVAQHGDGRVSSEFVDDNGLRLGQWVTVQRGLYRKGLLSSERTSRLESVGDWTWEPSDAAWERGCLALQNYIVEHGNTLVPAQHVVADDGFRLGKWVAVQRSAHRKGLLPQERTALLEALEGWVWERIDASWQNSYEALRRYVAERGDPRISANYTTRDGFRLGGWVTQQRTAYRVQRRPNVEGAQDATRGNRGLVMEPARRVVGGVLHGPSTLRPRAW